MFGVKIGGTVPKKGLAVLEKGEQYQNKSSIPCCFTYRLQQTSYDTEVAQPTWGAVCCGWMSRIVFVIFLSRGKGVLGHMGCAQWLRNLCVVRWLLQHTALPSRTVSVISFSSSGEGCLRTHGLRPVAAQFLCPKMAVATNCSASRLEKPYVVLSFFDTRYSLTMAVSSITYRLQQPSYDTEVA